MVHRFSVTLIRFVSMRAVRSVCLCVAAVAVWLQLCALTVVVRPTVLLSEDLRMGIVVRVVVSSFWAG